MRRDDDFSFAKLYAFIVGYFGVGLLVALLGLATALGLGCASGRRWCIDSVDTYVEGDSDLGVTSGLSLRWRPDGRCGRGES